MNLVLADEFRDGNVPAAYQGLPVAKAAFASLPSTVDEYYFRGDSACHEHELIDWLRDEKRLDGPQGFIGFGVSARMSPALRQAVEAVPEAQLAIDPVEPVQRLKLPEALLSPRQREILAMLYDRDMDVAEIARALGIDPQTVRSGHHKAMVKLRAHFRSNE